MSPLSRRPPQAWLDRRKARDGLLERVLLNLRKNASNDKLRGVQPLAFTSLVMPLPKLEESDH